MRPRFRSAISDLAACATADLSRWTHRAGVAGRGLSRHPHLGTPSDLARLSAVASSVGDGELSPWRSVLPPPCVEGGAFDTGGGEGRGAASLVVRHEAVAGGAELAGRLVVHGRPGAAGRRAGHRRRGAVAVAGGEPVDRAQARPADLLLRRAACRLCARERRSAARGIAAFAGAGAPPRARRAARRLRADGARAHDRRRDQRRAAMAAPRRLFAAALRVRQAGVRGAVGLAAGGGRSPPRHARHADGRVPLPRVRLPAGAAARRGPGTAGEPRMGRAVPARRPAAALVLHARGGARWRPLRRVHEPRLRALARRSASCIRRWATASRPIGRCTPSSRAASSARVRARAPSRPCCPTRTPTSSSP